ncbi:MAG: AraC family transcriptional regulator [Alphaproteobacteria bacterium]|nr:AraC family transcriptional regulator [Alphaproteobacteria bacterium]
MSRSDLIDSINRYADAQNAPDTPFETDIEGLSVVRCRHPTALQGMIYKPLLCLVLQGAKESYLGKNSVRFAEGDSLIVSLDLPSVSRVILADPARPYVAIALELDVALIRGLAAEISDMEMMEDNQRVIAVGTADTMLIETMSRLFSLVDNPMEQRILLSQTKREVHFRLLQARHGEMLRNLGQMDSHASRIARTISRIRADLTVPVSVNELSEIAGMSVSSFHEHFKAVTATTPLRYQKDLRLLEARQRLTSSNRPVTEIAYEVGYESPTQFSREYVRKFGLSPKRDRVAA